MINMTKTFIDKHGTKWKNGEFVDYDGEAFYIIGFRDKEYVDIESVDGDRSYLVEFKHLKKANEPKNNIILQNKIKQELRDICTNVKMGIWGEPDVECLLLCDEIYKII